MKLNAYTRISEYRKLVTAAPVTLKERQRFIKALLQQQPKLTGIIEVTDVSIQFKSDIPTVLAELKKLGWTQVHKGSKNEGVQVTKDDGSWPIRVRESAYEGLRLYAPTQDNIDTQAFDKVFVKMAKKVLPSGARIQTSSGYASYYKNNMRAEAASNLLSRILKNAAAAGFVHAKADQHSSPDGSSVGGTDMYIHPDGFTLSASINYGSSVGSNSVSATMVYKTNRGE